MDKNQIIGLVLIFLIFIGFMVFNTPSQEELANMRKQDSIARVQRQNAIEELNHTRVADSLAKQTADILSSEQSDSARQAAINTKYGQFATVATGEEKYVVLENNKIKVTLSTKGGQIVAVEVKDYTTYDGKPLEVIRKDAENLLALDFFAGNIAISTDELYFSYNGAQQQTANGSPVAAIFRAQTTDSDKWLEFTYTLNDDSYLLDYSISFHNLGDVINKNTNIDLNWNHILPVLERGNDWENQNSGLYYKYYGDDVDNLSFTSDDHKNMSTSLKWIAYKGQFFSSVMIANSKFENVEIASTMLGGKSNALKSMKSKIAITNNGQDEKIAFFFGPNKYKVLKDVQLSSNSTSDEELLDLQKLVPLGWGIFGWVNKIAIIPLFNWLGSFISNYGLIILIMTIIIKLVIFPLTYKSYLSSAKMRVLKPQVEAINKKFPRQDQAMQKQQAVMDLYKRADVNMMGGCLPILLQMPILIAMFRFFPASIELRQQSFLWASDLSSYDSILNLPFSIPFYGDHVSLFTLLMAAAIVVSTKINQTQMDTGGQQMPGMKLMMYMMPVMMVFWFNNYSSGLSYYYFLSNIITIGQTIFIRRFVDEDKLLAKLNENQAKYKNKKKSGFLARLEEAQRRQQKMMEEMQKKNNKRK